MRVGDRGVRDARPAESRDATGDETNQRAAVIRGEELHRVLGDRLVARRRHLERGRQIDPQLHGMQRATLPVEPFGGQLVVQDAPAGGHPLGVALADHPAAAVGVVVGDLPVHDVADGLETAVGVPGGTLRLSGRVGLGSRVVEQQERVRFRE